MKIRLWLILVLFLVACSKEMPSSPTAQVVAEVENATNQTAAVAPVIVQEVVLKDPLVSLEEQQREVYDKYNQVRRDIRGLESSLKKTTNVRKAQEELRVDYHERDSLKDAIAELEKKIQSIRVERRSLQEESKINETLENLSRDEKEVKARIEDNRFRIDKVREAIQETGSDQVKADLKMNLEELYAAQKDLDARLEKVYARLEEQQNNLNELRLEKEAKEQEAFKEDQKKLLLANVDAIDKLIQEKETAAKNTKDPDAKEKILSELNDLAQQKGNLREALEEL